MVLCPGQQGQLADSYKTPVISIFGDLWVVLQGLRVAVGIAFGQEPGYLGPGVWATGPTLDEKLFIFLGIEATYDLGQYLDLCRGNCKGGLVIG